jgi:LuxR family maltose regulon positive regulatory protein
MIIHRSPLIDAQRAITRLCEEAERATGDWLIMIDDFHSAQSGATEAMLDTLLSQLPPNFRIALSTRKRPKLPLAQLLADGQLLELNVDDLRFSDTEARELFGDKLKPTELEHLLSHSEGWAIVLQMARFLIAKHKDAGKLIEKLRGSEQDISHYLAQQVLASLSAESQRLLVDTAFLDKVTHELADHVRCASDSRAVLADLESIQAFFVPQKEGDRIWYRHHPMFGEFLWALHMEADADERRMSHRRAAEWYAKESLVLDAIRHARLAEDSALATAVFEAAGGATLGLSRGLSILRQALNLVPDEWIYGSPSFLLARALILYKSGQFSQAREHIEHVRKLMNRNVSAAIKRDFLLLTMLTVGYEDVPVTSSSLSDTERLLRKTPTSEHWFRGWINNLLAIMNFRYGNLTASRAAAVNAMAHYVSVGTVYTQFFAQVLTGIAEAAKGQFYPASLAYRAALRLARRHFASDRAMMALVHLLAAEISYERNRLKRAERLLNSALPTIENFEGWMEIYCCGYLTAASVAFHGRGLAAAQGVLDRAEATAETRNLPRLQLNSLIKKLELLTASGNLVAARDVAEQLAEGEGAAGLGRVRDEVIARSTWFELQGATIALALLALRQGHFQEVVALLNGHIAPSEAIERPAFLLRKLLMLAIAEYRLDRKDTAVTYLSQAIAHPMRRNYLRLFLELQTDLAVVVQGCIDDASGKKRSLSAGMSVIVGDEWLSGLLRKGQLHGTLSVREAQILAFLKNGLPNKSIANELRVSERTVKFHLQNIFEKLRVNNRTEALSVAHQRHLV